MDFGTIACLIFCASLAEGVPAAPAGYRRPVGWQMNRYPKSLQQIADESSSGQIARAKKVMTRIDRVNGIGRWKADLESLGRHACPAWFEDAKLGVFIDWNLYSVASYAREKSDAAFYPDWYCDFMHFNPEESKNAHLGANGIRSYHEANWGKDFKRDDFIPLFTGRKFDANRLCGFFKDCGARYFVPFLKHHDGFCLWDSTWTRRNSVQRGPMRNFAAEMVEACKIHGLKFGFYFSTGEWEYPFLKDDGSVEVRPGRLGTGAPWPQDQKEFETRISGKIAVRDYKREYVVPQAVEFIDRYDPDLVWLDGEWDSSWYSLGSADIVAYFYNHAEGRKEVAVNDRFGLRRELPAGHAREEMFKNLLRCHCGDFYTDESGDVADQIDPAWHHAWEECTGISKCYGNHWNESEANVMSEREFLMKFIGIVARGGNLLLLVNLDAEGAIPETEERRLRQIGAWLKVNGEAIYGTRICPPFSTPNVDYTQSKDGKTVYAIIKDVSREVVLGCKVPESPTVEVLATGVRLDLISRDDGYAIQCPPELVKSNLPVALRIRSTKVEQNRSNR